MLARLGLALSVFCLAGCLSQTAGDLVATPVHGSALPGDSRSFLATTQQDTLIDRNNSETLRTPDMDRSGVIWNVSTRGELNPNHLDRFRSEEVRYSSFSYSIETKRQKSWISGEHSSDEVRVTGGLQVGDEDFSRALQAAPTGTEIMLYVHGFNNTPEVAVKRMAQLCYNLGFHGFPAVFTWPSHGGTGRLAEFKGASWYLYDLQSANFSRDALSTLLDKLSAMPNITRVHLIAHSMGSWLTMESLRQIAIAGQIGTLNKIASVILFAPDVDAQVFEKQVIVTDLNSGRANATFGDVLAAFRAGSPETRKFAQKIIVFAGKDDKAIGGSGWIYGAPRIGTAEISNRLAESGVRFVDTKDYKADDAFSHYKANDPRALAQVREIIGNDPVGGRAALLANSH